MEGKLAKVAVKRGCICVALPTNLEKLYFIDTIGQLQQVLGFSIAYLANKNGQQRNERINH